MRVGLEKVGEGLPQGRPSGRAGRRGGRRCAAGYSPPPMARLTVALVRLPSSLVAKA